jgi:hypothetical protein
MRYLGRIQKIRLEDYAAAEEVTLALGMKTSSILRVKFGFLKDIKILVI